MVPEKHKSIREKKKVRAMSFGEILAKIAAHVAEREKNGKN